ncbi:MAG: ROK family protein, partial [Saprospiraceae bacterium]|nr:ROK family protein [Saprospiraceae bacterium]
MKPLWGIDLGGTKIEGVVLEEMVTGKVLCRTRIATEQEYGYEHILERISLLIESMKRETGLSPAKLGIGTPGSIDPHTGLLKNSNTTCLNGQPLLSDLREQCGLEVRLANDANCFAVAEARMGVVREEMPEATNIFGVIMGTGVGGGIVID